MGKKETEEKKIKSKNVKVRRNFRFSEATGIGSVCSSGADSRRRRGTMESDETRPWLNRRRQRQCVNHNDEDLMDSPCSVTGAAAMVETNVDRSPSTASYGRIAENPTPTTSKRTRKVHRSIQMHRKTGNCVGLFCFFLFIFFSSFSFSTLWRWDCWQLGDGRRGVVHPDASLFSERRRCGD